MAEATDTHTHALPLETVPGLHAIHSSLPTPVILPQMVRDTERLGPRVHPKRPLDKNQNEIGAQTAGSQRESWQIWW